MLGVGLRGLDGAIWDGAGKGTVNPLERDEERTDGMRVDDCNLGWF